VLALALVGFSVGAWAAADADLVTAQGTFDAGFSLVKTTVLGVVGFGLTIGLIKWLRRR